MHGLFCVFYDYYEWKDIIVVSNDKEKLKEYHNKKNDGYPLVGKDESIRISNDRSERDHYVIDEIECLT